MSSASAIGLQNPAFFVGRAELLEWVNGLLNLKLTKVEQVLRASVHTLEDSPPAAAFWDFFSFCKNV